MDRNVKSTILSALHERRARLLRLREDQQDVHPPAHRALTTRIAEVNTAIRHMEGRRS